MRVLLDTHLFLWAFLQPTKLSREAKRLIENSDVHISAASIWEISIKSSLGKLKVKPSVMLDAIEPAGFNLLNITAEHAARVFELPDIHRDPFDRMLVAQAYVEPMLLLTNDEMLRDYSDFVRVV